MQPHDRALELLALAGRDERAAHILEASPDADDAVIGFHYQQATEKLLKALLAERNVNFPKTHDLLRLVELVEDEGYEPPMTADQIDRLAPFAVTLRYERDEGGMDLDREDARALTEDLRTWVEAQLR